jgi:hypothetical protein
MTAAWPCVAALWSGVRSSFCAQPYARVSAPTRTPYARSGPASHVFVGDVSAGVESGAHSLDIACARRVEQLLVHAGASALRAGRAREVGARAEERDGGRGGERGAQRQRRAHVRAARGCSTPPQVRSRSGVGERSSGNSSTALGEVASCTRTPFWRQGKPLFRRLPEVSFPKPSGEHAESACGDRRSKISCLMTRAALGVPSAHRPPGTARHQVLGGASGKSGCARCSKCTRFSRSPSHSAAHPSAAAAGVVNEGGVASGG